MSRGSCTRSEGPVTSSEPKDPPHRPPTWAAPDDHRGDGRGDPPDRFDRRRLDPRRLDLGRVDWARLDPRRLDLGRVDWARLDPRRIDFARLVAARPDAPQPSSADRRAAVGRLLRDWRDAVSMPIARLPIRVRLAGTSAALTLLILCVFATAIGTLTARRIRSDFTSQLTTAADNIGNQLNIVDNSLGQIVIRPPLDQSAAPDHAVVRVFDSNLSVLGTTYDAPDLGAPSLTPLDTDGYRIVTREAKLSSGYVVYVQYARLVSELDKTIGRLQVFLIFGVLGGTGLAFAAGSMIARRAMAPIAALTAAAGEVERTRDPSVRVPQSESEDEVAELGRTLDGMLHALSSARAETEAMLDRQRAFVADASHELRTPLTSVLANLELLSETLRGEEGSAARSALRSSQRMRRLVEDLLLLARADVGREQVKRPFDLADVVVEAAGELGPLSGGHVVELDARPAQLHGARDDVQRVAINLIENALRHTPPGTQVTVSTRATPGGGAVLCVSDNGPGIPPELAPRLFERFVRGTGDRGGSVGLGLAIVAAVAEAHNGSVTVKPSPTGGARFVVNFGGDVPPPAEPAPREGIGAS